MNQSFHVMLKPRGPICNLDCAYCFYLQKISLYPDASYSMDEVVLESFTHQYIEAQNTPEITFAWQGGEPTLMGLDFYRKALEYQRKHHKPGQKINNSFQTNGVLLDDDWCQFFKRNNFLVGVSLDGPHDLHDIYRVDKGGSPTFERVIQGVKLLQKYNIEYNILACVNSFTVQHPVEVYRFFRDDVKTNFIQFIPIIEKSPDSPGKTTERSINGKSYGQFLSIIFDEWVKNDVGKVFVQLFDVALAAWAGLRPGLCVHETTCGRALAMEHNGDLFSCDHFVSPEYYLGNVINQSLVELINLPRQLKFGRDKKTKLPRQCRKCWVRFICNGGCPKDRLMTTFDGEPGLNILCAGYLSFFSHIDRPMRRMVELLQTNQAPAQIMDELRFMNTNHIKQKISRQRYKKK